MAREDGELEESYELADRGDDRPGLEDLADDDVVDEADDDDFDDLDDATEEDVDFIVALYRDDGVAQAEELNVELANDLDDWIAELRRYPGDFGTIGMCSIAGEFFVVLRVRGQQVEVVISDGAAAYDWPLARDVVDFLGEELDEDDESAPLGDLGMLVDLGLPEFDLEQLCLDYDDPSDEVALTVADKINLGDALREVID